MNETICVNKRAEKFDIDIGRKPKYNAIAGHDYFWGNPYLVSEFGRAGAIERYEKYIRNSEIHLKRLHELKGKKLGCYCKPQYCHGDVLVKLVKEFCE
jgi:hypothetical protein